MCRVECNKTYKSVSGQQEAPLSVNNEVVMEDDGMVEIPPGLATEDVYHKELQR